MGIQWPIWGWRLLVGGGLLLALFLYARGRRRLPPVPEAGPDHTPVLRLPDRWAPTAFVLALAFIALALLSPLNQLATELFVFRVLQHNLLLSVAPALFWISDPGLSLWSGLPAGFRSRWSGRPFPGRPGHRWLIRFTGKGHAWLAFVSTTWIWYDPAVHAASRRLVTLHALESLTLLGVALLTWWHITAAAPRLHQPLPTFVHLVYILACGWPIKVMGAAVLFNPEPAYLYADPGFSAWGVSLADNQIWGGLLIWGFGSLAYSVAAFQLIRRWLGHEESKPTLPLDTWLTKENMLAPGMDR